MNETDTSVLPTFPAEASLLTDLGQDDLVAGEPVMLTEAPKVEEVEEEFDFAPPTPNNNATLELPYSTPIAEALWDELATIVALPPDTSARTLNYGEMQPNAQLADGLEGEHWAETVEDGLRHGSFHDNMLPAAKREGADYRQRIMAGDRALSIASPRLADDDGPLLTGERGMLRINAMLGRGAIVQIPLWHSGFYITLKSPGEVDLLDTFQQITDNEIILGRITNGLAFANHAVVDNAAIVDLAMKNLYETSVKGLVSADKIRSMIKAPDLHMLAWGLACVTYPRGFQFERSLLDPKGQVINVLKETLNVGACLWVDRGSLDDWQVSHMSKRTSNSMSEESVKLYCEHFTRGAAKSVMFNDTIGVTMRVPSIDEYLNAGQLWVDEMAAAVNQAFTQETNRKKRNDMILDRARATSMRQYVHWIESLDMPKANKRMVDREGLAQTCNSLSSDNLLREKFYEVMKDFINESTVALIAVPQVHPGEAGQSMPRFENIIPLDPISVFFTLLFQKIQQIRMRP